MTTRRATIFSILLVLATIAVYWPVRRAEFLNFDDTQYVTNNPKVFHGLTRAGIPWAFTTFHAANWHPVTWLSHMLDCQLFGDNPAGHHWVSVGFHAANAVLLFLWLWRATRSMERSAFVAAVFALHPLHVESVAWIAERKDVLSGFFFMLTLIAYGQYVSNFSSGLEASLGKATNPGLQRKKFAWYCVALLVFSCGLMAKPMLVTVPFLLMLVDVWPLRRMPLGSSLQAQNEKDVAKGEISRVRNHLWLVAEKIPFLILAAASAVLTFHAQSLGGAVAKFSIIPIGVRLLNASVSYVWYLEKTFWPAGLCAYYAYPGEILWQPAVAAALVLTVISVAVIWNYRRAPYEFVGWFWYLGMLMPVIGIIQVGGQTRADRYSYLPMIGILIMVTWGVADLLSRWRVPRVALATGACVVVAAISFASWSQVHFWKNSVTLFERALKISPEGDFLAHHNLGHALSMQGRQEEAIEHFREALRIRPDYAVAHLNWANSLAIQGKTEEAITHYRAAIRLNTNYEEAYYNLGKALVLTGDLAEGKTNLLAALRCKPDYAEVFTALGNLMLLQGNHQEGLRLLLEGVKANPEIPEGQYFLGAVLVRQGRTQEGVRAFRMAIKLRQKYSDALNDLAWVLATVNDPAVRNVKEALSLSRRACEADHPANPLHLDTLGVALSETGQFDEAIEQTRRAIQIAQDRHESALAEKLESRLPLYSQHRAHSSPP